MITANKNKMLSALNNTGRRVGNLLCTGVHAKVVFSLFKFRIYRIKFFFDIIPDDSLSLYAEIKNEETK